MKRIVIDAGHGGSDSGACKWGYYEKDVNIGIALKLGEKLKEKGIKVIYTRNKDAFISLQNRCRISNREEADIFVSIHCNSAANTNATGIETWKYKGIGGITKRLAENVQSELIAATGAKNRGVKEGTFYVLKYTSAPAVLIETGFISNETERKKLFTDDYQNKIASAICSAILKTIDV